MKMSRSIILATLIVVAIAMIIAGCCGDDPTSPTVQTGTIEINPSPDSINPPWTLNGPDDYSSSGTGDHTLIGLAVGEYSVTWLTVVGWITPTGVTQTLTADGTLHSAGLTTRQAASRFRLAVL